MTRKRRSASTGAPHCAHVLGFATNEFSRTDRGHEQHERRNQNEPVAQTLEEIKGLDLGFGTTIGYSLSEHQGSHKIWGTRLDETCTYTAVDLD